MPHSYLFLKGMAEFRWRKKYGSGWRFDHYFISQTGYAVFSDSGWFKSADAFRIQLRWLEKSERRMTHTYSANLQSQWLNSWQSAGAEKVWQGGFMNPSLMEIGYSFTLSFLKNSNLLLTPATLQVNVQPRKIRAPGDESPFLKSGKSLVYTRYGFSGYLTIDESFYNNTLLLQHQSHLFFNALTTRQIQFDISNRICIRFLKYMQLRLETTLIYLPEQSLQIQYRQEVLLGIFYEKRK